MDSVQKCSAVMLLEGTFTGLKLVPLNINSRIENVT